MSELKAFDVGLGRYAEDGSPCVVAFDADQNPLLLDEQIYLKSEADKVIAEKDKVIAEFKARIQLDDGEMAGFLDLEEECGGGDLRNYIAELKGDNETLKKQRDDLFTQGTQKAFDLVGEKLRHRATRRALWLERARRASAWQIHFALSHNHSIKREFTINGASSPHDRMVTMRTARDWAMIWENVERKCRAKAEELK